MTHPTAIVRLRFHVLGGLAALALALAGCGGGGGGGGGGTPSTTTAVVAGRVLPSGSGLEAPSALGGTEAASLALAPERIVPGEAVVWFAPDLTPADAMDALSPDGALRIEKLLTEAGPALVAGGPEDAEGTRRWIETLAGDPVVARAEPNYRHSREDAPVSYAPNDPVTKARPFSFSIIRTEGAWQYTRGDADVVVAVVDTGIGLDQSPHPDLDGRFYPGWDFVKDQAEGWDSFPNGFHGTGVAGIIGATANNSYGIAGIAPEVKLLAVRAGGSDGFYTFDSAAAIRWAAGLSVPGVPTNPTPARVINMSYGGPASSTVEHQAIQDAAAAGVVLVAAAGNSSTAVDYPAAYPEVIAVSAVRRGPALASYSCYGPEVELAAPGGDVRYFEDLLWTTTYDGQPLAPDIGPTAGTSFASPHVAAVAALVISANPALSASDVRDVLEETATDLGASGRDDLYGFGLVDAQAAVERALELSANPPAPKPARLFARTPDLRLTPAEPEADLRIANLGQGEATIDSVAVHEIVDGQRVADPAWLSATIVDATANGDGDALVRVSADFGEVGAEPRHGLLEISGSGGQVLVPVLAAADVVPDLGDVVVTLTDAATGEVVATTTTGLADGYDFRFEDVPAGDYFLDALVDRNDDGTAGRPDEWSGSWPSADRQALSVGAGESRTDVALPVAETAEAIRAGTGGGAIDGVLGVLVRDSETGLPISAARVVLGDGDREQFTDDRGIALFSGVTGAQTVTAVASGYGAETFLDTDAARIGFDLVPKAAVEETYGVAVSLAGAYYGETSYVFTGVDFQAAIPGLNGSPQNTTVRVSGPAVVNVLVVDDATGTTVAVGYAEITRETLDLEIPYVLVDALDITTAPTLQANARANDFTLNEWFVIPALVGPDAAAARILGLAVSDQAGNVETHLWTETGLEDLTATVLIRAGASEGERSIMKVVRSRAEFLYGGYFVATLPAPPAPDTPADGATVAEGDTLGFSLGGQETYGFVRLTRTTDGATWTIYCDAGTDSIRLPQVGVLGAGSWTWEVDSVRCPGMTYDTISIPPGRPADSLSALDSLGTSEPRTVTVE